MISISSRIFNRSLLGISALALGPLLLLAGCGGGASGGGSNPPPPPTTYTLTVESTNPSSGVAISYGNSLNNLVQKGTTTFTISEDSGTTILLQAPTTASNGNTFASWSDCTSTTGQTCSITINSNTTVTANYTTPSPTVYTLTVATTNSASGTALTAAPADNNTITTVTSGTSQDTLTYDSGTPVTITAPLAAPNGNTFSSWTGCNSVSGASNQVCAVTVSASITVTANYSTTAPTTYTLTVNTGGATLGITPTALSSSGTNPLTLSYDAGTVVTLTAPATSGSNTFSSWTGCMPPTGDTCTVTVSANTTVTANYSTPSTYTLNVHTSNPATGVTITDSPADNSNITSDPAPVTLHYPPNTNVTITAPTSVTGGNVFSSWTGCTSATNVCGLTLSANNTTVTANYAAPIPTVTISPSTSSLTIGSSQQFTASVQNESNTTVTWSVAVASGSGSAGTISSTGLYETPYPAPTSVTVTATSVADPTVKATMTFTLSTPATTAGPALTVNATNITRAISPLIYGMNAYLLDSGTAGSANITVARWGGDDVSRYNYQNGVTNSANDYYFENFSGAGGMLGGGAFNAFLTAADSAGIKTIGTAPVNGWVSNSTQKACSFTKAAYPGQVSYNGDNCGNGVYANGSGGCTSSSGCSIFGNATVAAITSIATPPPTAPGAGNATTTWADATWTGGWVNCLVTSGSYCSATGSKDATIWDLDNEPAWWDAVHRDVHPSPSTYDEVTQGGIGTALAIKTADPNALVAGPVIDYWWNYFYSKQDIENGWAHGSPCYQPWSDPTDRQAHGGVPMIEYYLQQMAAASNTYNMRLLDYLTIHSYSAATYNGSSVGLTTAGDTGEQQARMNSTRALWDSTYTDPNFPQPNYVTDTNYTSNCSTPLQAPQIIPMMQSWITAGWTGTTYPAPGTSIDEYNFGGTESINGAVTQADVLGIFGKYGLDMGVFWPTNSYTGQVPGNMAFEIYRNYDGSKSTFGDSELNSSTVDQSQLAVYAAKRTSDNAITIVVINKAFGPLTSTLSIDNLTSGTNTAHVYQYSNANRAAIVAQPDATITPPAAGTISTLSATFPAQSITLFVIPQ